MTTGIQGVYDVVLQNRRTEPNEEAETILGLILANSDDNDNIAWREYRVPPLPARRSNGEVSFTHRDPTYDLVFSQTDWSGGALQTYYDPTEPNRYYTAQVANLSREGAVTLGVAPRDVVVESANTLPTGAFWSAMITADDIDTTYAAINDTIYLFSVNNTNIADLNNDPSWAIDFTHPDNTRVTDLIEFDGTVYAAFGNSKAYYYKPQGGAWTASALAVGTDANANFADFFTTARNNSGTFVVWKAIEPNLIQWSADPTTDAWAPTTAFTVGDSGRNINNIHSLQDTFVVSKTNGMWIWSAPLTNFINVTSEWDNNTLDRNGTVGHEWHNELYFAAAQDAFLRYTGTTIEDLSFEIEFQREGRLDGRPTALASSSRELFVAIQSRSGALIDRLHYSDRQRRWVVHQSQVDGMAAIHQILTFHGASIMLVGVDGDGVPTSKILVGEGDYFFRDEGWFETAIWHGGIPDTPKSCLALTIWGSDLTADQYIDVDLIVDDKPPVAVNRFQGPGPVETLFFENMAAGNHLVNAVGRFFQLRFTLHNEDLNRRSPRLFAFELHTQAYYGPVRAWQIDCVIGDILLKTGVRHPYTKAELERIFLSLETQVFPIIMYDDLGHGHGGSELDGSEPKLVRLVDYQRRPESGSVDDQQEIWRLTLQEALPPRPL